MLPVSQLVIPEMNLSMFDMIQRWFSLTNGDTNTIRISFYITNTFPGSFLYSKFVRMYKYLLACPVGLGWVYFNMAAEADYSSLIDHASEWTK